MRIDKLSDMIGGWFVGDFSPSAHRTKDFEVAIKRVAKGVTEAAHFQRIATEITVVAEGTARMGEIILFPGDIITIFKGERADFEALTDVVLVALKFPSVPQDKVVV
jgi:mannose-6-phosphate isomerase-like protein (cupin superfamily)